MYQIQIINLFNGTRNALLLAGLKDIELIVDQQTVIVAWHTAYLYCHVRKMDFGFLVVGLDNEFHGTFLECLTRFTAYLAKETK